MLVMGVCNPAGEKADYNALRFWLLTCSFAGASLPQNSMRGNRSIHNPKFDASRASLLTEP